MFEALYPSRVNTDWYAMVFFFCGWLAFSLYMKQVFYLDLEEDEKEDSRESNLNMFATDNPMEKINNIRERDIFDQSGKIIGELESVRLKGPSKVTRSKNLIWIMI